MRKPFKIHKPTHKFFGASGSPAIAIGQMRGDVLYLNRYENGRLVQKTWAVGSACYHLTGYGTGVSKDAGPREKDAMQSAWIFTFGPDAPPPVWCEIA